MDEDPLIAEDKPLTDAEIDELERSAMAAKADSNVKLFATPQLILRLIRSHRQSKDEAEENYLQWSEALDTRQDLAEGTVELRKVLRAIRDVNETDDHKRVLRMRALAAMALRREELGDEAMRLEFGHTTDDFTRYELPERHFEELPLPCRGQIWLDGLGGKYRIIDVDEKSDVAHVESLVRVAAIQVADLFTYAWRSDEPAGEAGQGTLF